MELTYYGMASANGLESFFQDQNATINTGTKLGSRFGDMIFGEEENQEMSEETKRMLGGMTMAAHANMHRRSVVYRAKVTQELADLINETMKRNPEYALELLKKHASEIALAQTPNAKKFWEQIPNPILDPFN